MCVKGSLRLCGWGLLAGSPHNSRDVLGRPAQVLADWTRVKKLQGPKSHSGPWDNPANPCPSGHLPWVSLGTEREAEDVGTQKLPLMVWGRGGLGVLSAGRKTPWSLGSPGSRKLWRAPIFVPRTLPLQ